MKIRRDGNESLPRELVANSKLPVVLACGSGHYDDDSCFAVTWGISDLGVDLCIPDGNIYPLGLDGRVSKCRFRGIESRKITVGLAVQASHWAAALASSCASAFTALRFGHGHQADVMTCVIVWRERDECRMIIELRIKEVDRSRPSLLRI